MKNNLVVLSGSSNQPLAEKICENLGVPLTPTKIERFSNENLSVQIQDVVRKRDVFIVQSLYPNPNTMLVELLLMIDAARSASAKEICVVMPHYSYARSDKKDAPHISVAAKLFARTMEAAGADRFLTMTLHSEHVQAFFDRPADQLQGNVVICDELRKRDMSNAVALFDFGQDKRAGNYARALGIPMAVYDKVRVNDTEVKIRSVVGDIEDKDVWLFDDEVASAVSMVTIADLIQREYRPRSINGGSVHGLLCGQACPLIVESPISELVVTNTVNVPDEKRISKLTVLDVSPVIAEGIKRIYNGESISEMLKK